jgi:epoxyqueuosine reductase QueG
MSLSAEIREFIETRVDQANQVDFYRKPLVGFSAATDPWYGRIKEVVGPHHLQPEDVLPGVKTILSFFLPFSKKVIQANRQDPLVPAREWVDSYLHANNLIDEISQALVAEMRARGIEADMVNSTHNYDAETLKAPWSHRSAAFVAGLGRFGLNRMLITPVGAAGRFGTVFLA